MNIIENINNTTVPEMDWTTEKNISYTQLSAWMECPHRWKQMYIDKIKQPPSIHLSPQNTYTHRTRIPTEHHQPPTEHLLTD